MAQSQDESHWRGEWYDDDTRIDTYAMFVLEDIPNDVSLPPTRGTLQC